MDKKGDFSCEVVAGGFVRENLNKLRIEAARGLMNKQKERRYAGYTNGTLCAIQTKITIACIIIVVTIKAISKQLLLRS